MGIASIPTAISDALAKIKNVAQAPLKAFLQAVASSIKKAFAALLKKLRFGGQKKPLLDPVDVDKKGKYQLYVTADGKVWLHASPDQDVVACLTKAQKTATGQQHTMIGAALTQAAQLSGDVKTVAANAAKTQTTSTLGQTDKTTQKATQEVSDLAMLLSQLSCVCGLPGKGSCVIAGTRALDENGEPTAIEKLPLLGGVMGFTATDGLGWLRRLPSAVVVEHYREYRLLLEEDPADVVEAALIRPAGWLECLQGRDNGQVYLDLGEVGVRGWAWVLGVHPCPERKGSGNGCLVTGRFKHSRGHVLELRIAGESQVLGITPSHLVWCVDRVAWVMAGELLPGERMLAADGNTPVVEAVSLREQPEPVFNIEVEGDHCYRVGEQGILVHNASAPAMCNPASGSVAYDPVLSVTFTDASGNMVSGQVGTGVIAYLTPANVGLPRVDLDEPNWWSKLQAVAGGPIQLGHILASSLGGKGKKSWDNLTPLYQRANTPAMRTCEGFLKRLVTECNYCVTVHVQVKGYGMNMSVPVAARPAMPTTVVIDWVSDCGQTGTFTIDNVTTATVQDPCRVANLPCRP